MQDSTFLKQETENDFVKKPIRKNNNVTIKIKHEKY